MKDCFCVSFLVDPNHRMSRHLGLGTYGELPRPPQSLNDAQVVQQHHGEQQLRRIGIAPLPDQQPPWLAVPPDDLQQRRVEIWFQVADADEEGACDGAEEEETRDRREGEAGGQHREANGRCGGIVLFFDQVTRRTICKGLCWEG